MKISIEGNEKEITGLVLALQNQQSNENDKIALADTLKKILLEQAEAASERGDTVANDITTKELVEELSKREGVKKIIAEPYQDVEVKVNGPAIVLVIED